MNKFRTTIMFVTLGSILGAAAILIWDMHFLGVMVMFISFLFGLSCEEELEYTLPQTKNELKEFEEYQFYKHINKK